MSLRFELDVMAQRVTFGAGLVEQLPAELEALSLRRLLLIATGSAKPVADDLADRLEEHLAGRVHEVVQHVPASLVTRALSVAREAGADGVVTIGGGSAIGLGKALAVETGLPLVAVPTTYSGSEVTSIYGVTGEHKRTGSDPRALPKAVVYDARLTIDMPPHVTATSGLNALAHCVEALYAPGANPLTSLLAEEGIRVLTRALPTAVDSPQDLAGREEALYGAYLAGSALAAGTALQHTLCHVIGGTYSVGHADLHAVLLPHVAAYNTAAAPEALQQAAAAMGTTDAALGLYELAKELGAPTDLASLGLPESALDEVAERTVAAIGHRNPRHVDTTSLRRLLENAYAGSSPGANRTNSTQRLGGAT